MNDFGTVLFAFAYIAIYWIIAIASFALVVSAVGAPFALIAIVAQRVKRAREQRDAAPLPLETDAVSGSEPFAVRSCV